MKLRYIKITLKLFTVITLASIGIFAQGDLGSMRWSLTEINRKKVKNSKAFIEIARRQNRFSGNAGCNRMFGEVSVKGKNINFGEIGTTKMFCGEERVMKLESDLIGALGKVTHFEKSGTTLRLYIRNRLILKFKGAAKTGSNVRNSIKLEDMKWVLEKIQNKPFQPIVPAPFINFDKTKGSAGGNTGCNVFGGNYAVKNKLIEITGIVSTMRACLEDERMDLEREFKNALVKANRYRIIEGKLNLYRDKNLLLTLRSAEK